MLRLNNNGSGSVGPDPEAFGGGESIIFELLEGARLVEFVRTFMPDPGFMYSA
jgi:hypothetical protein